MKLYDGSCFGCCIRNCQLSRLRHVISEMILTLSKNKVANLNAGNSTETCQQNAPKYDISNDSGLGLDGTLATAAQQTPTGFSDLPKEIRDMIYAEIAGRYSPRLLPFEPFWPIHWAPAARRLPVTMFLNREAAEETRRIVTIVRRLGTFPWQSSIYFDRPFSYINPDFDTVYGHDYHCIPKAIEVPGLQRLAIPISQLHLRRNWVLVESRKIVWKRLFQELKNLPCLKELLLVRSTLRNWATPGLIGGRRSLVFETDITTGIKNEVPRIEVHPCGYFGLVNRQIEHIEAKMKTDWGSEFVLREAEGCFRESWALDHVAHPMPKISVVYSYWVGSDGSWNYVNENMNLGMQYKDSNRHQSLVWKI